MKKNTQDIDRKLTEHGSLLVIPGSILIIVLKIKKSGTWKISDNSRIILRKYARDTANNETANRQKYCSKVIAEPMLIISVI